MTTIHPPDSEIQAYSLDRRACAPETAEHIAQCASCAARVMNYTMLFSAVRDAPKPVIDFDVAGTVLARLPGYKKASGLSDWLVYAVAFAAIAFLGMLAWVLQRDLPGMFDRAASMMMYVLLIPIAGILIWQGYDVYRRYQRQSGILG